MDQSVTMDLENLQQRQSNLLIQYKQAVADYVAYVQPGHNTLDLVNIQGRAYIGTGTAGQSTATTLEKCQVACAANSSCTGATFVSNQCQLRTGDAPLVPASQASYAIVPKAKQLLLNMEDLNTQLLSINQQIADTIARSQSTYQEVQEQASSASQDLLQSYEQLQSERESVQRLLSEYDTLEASQSETELKVTQRYYTYLLLFGLAISIGFLVVNISVDSSSNRGYGESSSSNYYSPPKVEYGKNILGHGAYYILFMIILAVVFLNSSRNFFSVTPISNFLHTIYTWIPQFQVQPI